MTMKKALLAATMLTLPAVASAQPVTGPYIGLGAGANWVNNPEKFDIQRHPAAPQLRRPDTTSRSAMPARRTSTPAGPASFSLGWGFGNGFRAEIEGNYRANEIDSIRGFNLAPVGRTGGCQYTYGVMVNVFYDFDSPTSASGQSYFQPYVGVGVGYAWTQWHNIRGISALRARCRCR